MKRIHYIHLGMARSGTTWLHYNLIKHPEIDYKVSKENAFLYDSENGIPRYLEHFNSYEVSFNNHPYDWELPDSTLQKLDAFTTSYGISFRNPYEYLHSLKNYMREPHTGNDWVAKRIAEGQTDYVGAINRIKSSCKNPLLIMVVDDLIADPQKYVDAITAHMGLTQSVQVDTTKLNWRHYLIDIEFTADDVALINSSIDEFSDYMQRDFSHWKRNA